MRTIFSITIGLIFLSSCTSLKPFTQDLSAELNTEEIKTVQFFLSQDIILYKTVDMEDAEVKDGKISLKKRHRAKEVLIRKGTPGAVIFSPKEDRLAVSFDKDDDLFLIFGTNERYNDRYTLLGKEWSNEGFGIVTYGGEEYITSTRNAIATLMVSVKNVNTTYVRQREANGRRL